ncbi:hypothetical protein GOODEAATRI_031733, partial [Goodea atripinnis]
HNPISSAPYLFCCRSATGSKAVYQNSSLRNDTASRWGLPVFRPRSRSDEEGHRVNEDPGSRWCSARRPDRRWTGGCRALHGVDRYSGHL